MGVFYSTPMQLAAHSAPAVTNVLMEALSANPVTIPDAQQIAARLAATLVEQSPPSSPPPGNFEWIRFVCALILVALVLLAGIYCAQDDKLQKWSDVLLHTFTVHTEWAF